MKKRGSAIVIAMLLISAIGVITFGIARLIFIENRTVALYENGAVAYYAAESGLEEGFLRYRYNQNVEVPFNNWTLTSDDSEKKYFQTIYNNYDTTNFEADKVITEGNIGISTAYKIDPLRQTYDLRIGHIGSNGKPFYGIPILTNGGDVENYKVDEGFINSVPDAPDFNSQYGAVFIPKNDSIKIDLSGYNFLIDDFHDLNLYAKLFVPTGTLPEKKDCQALLEIKFTIIKSGETKEYKDLIKPTFSGDPDSDFSCDNALGSKGINSLRTIDTTTSNTDASGNIIYNASDLWQTVGLNGGTYTKSDTKDLKVVLTIHPIYYDVAIGLVNNNCAGNLSLCENKTKEDVVSGPFTTVESTGYFAGVAKKLTANIDRQSGSLYDLYDYVIFAQN